MNMRIVKQFDNTCLSYTGDRDTGSTADKEDISYGTSALRDPAQCGDIETEASWQGDGDARGCKEAYGQGGSGS